MSTLADLISQDTLDRYRIKAEDALIELESHAERGGLVTLPVNKTMWEPSVAIIRYVHSYLLSRATPDSRLPAPFIAVYSESRVHGKHGGMGISAALKSLDSTLTKIQISSAISYILTTLSVHKLLMKQPGSHATYWLADWPEGLVLRTITSAKTPPTGKLARQIERDVQKFHELQSKEFITVTYDISKIPLPEPDPAAVLEYLKKIVASFNKMKLAYDENQNRLKQLTVENIQLREQIEKVHSSEAWSGISEQIKRILSNGSDSEE